MKNEVKVSEFAEKWIKIAIAGKSLSQQCAVKNAICNHVLPIIGDLPIRCVEYSDAALVMAAVAHYSYSLRSKVLANMRRMFEMARRSHLITENPCEGLKAGAKNLNEREALTEQQQRKLEQAVEGTRAETFVLLGLYTGMRREEILALRWDCIDLEAEAPYLYVQRALRWEHNRPCVSDTLKSPTAKRKLPLPQKLVGHLASLPKDEGFLFGGAQPLSCTQFRHLWKIVSKRLDFHVTSHQLRHTYITRLVLGGVNLKYVQYLAGHSSLNVTLKIYTHILAENIPSMASEINSALCA